jgi:hypothetical protein
VNPAYRTLDGQARKKIGVLIPAFEDPDS